MRVIQLDGLPDLPGPGSLRWRPVRRQLGVRAFGTNAYTAVEAGSDVVEPHSEEESGHQELYFVHAGTARFTVDDQTFDAPAGTYVLVEPAERRHAVATAPGTVVLSFGGPPTFAPSAWEWSFEALARRATDVDAARAIFADGLAAHPDDPGLLYNLACLEALEGRRDAALAALRGAIERRPQAAEWARTDEDFAPLREDPGFAALVAAR